MIQFYKIINNLDIVHWYHPPTLVSTVRQGPAACTRGHCLRFSIEEKTSTHRNYFYLNRVINKWNNLPEHVVMAISVNSFKNRLDSFINTNINTQLWLS